MECRDHLDPRLVNIIANLGRNVNEEEIHVIMNDWYGIDEYGNDVDDYGVFENNDTINNNNNNLNVIIPNDEYIPNINDIVGDIPIVYTEGNLGEENIQHTSTPEYRIQQNSTPEYRIQQNSTPEYDLEAEFQELIRNTEGSNDADDDVFHQQAVTNYTSDTSDSDHCIG